jgi:hypothetical protein
MRRARGGFFSGEASVSRRFIPLLCPVRMTRQRLDLLVKTVAEGGLQRAHGSCDGDGTKGVLTVCE